MRHLIGLVLCSYGLWLLYGALRHRRNHTLAPATGPLAVLGDIVPPLVIMGIGIAALEVVLAYAVVGESGLFSLFDLVGVLFVLASYGAWILVKTRYRCALDAGPG